METHAGVVGCSVCVISQEVQGVFYTLALLLTVTLNQPWLIPNEKHIPVIIFVFINLCVTGMCVCKVAKQRNI